MKATTVDSELYTGSARRQLLTHPNSSNDHTYPSAEALHEVQTGKCEGDVDRSEDDLRLKTVAQACGLKNSRAIIEEEIGPSKLLKCLQRNTEECPMQHCWSSEDFPPGMLAPCLLCFESFAHFGQLFIYLRVVFMNAQYFDHGSSCIIFTTIAELMFWRLWEQQYAKTEYDRPQKSNTHRDAPRSGVVDSLRPIIDDICEEDAHGDE